MSGIHHQPDERQSPITPADQDLSLANTKGPCLLTDHERLEQLAERNGLDKKELLVEEVPGAFLPHELLRRATFDDSGRLTKLDLSYTGVRDISALEGCMALTDLNVSRTGVRDISALEGCMALTYLNVSSTGVKDISPIAGCEALTLLNLNCTEVRDISALKACIALAHLGLWGTNVSDVSPVDRPGLAIFR